MISKQSTSLIKSAMKAGRYVLAVGLSLTAAGASGQSASESRSALSTALRVEQQQEATEQFLEARQWFRDNFARLAQDILIERDDPKAGANWMMRRDVTTVTMVNGCTARIATPKVIEKRNSNPTASFTLDFRSIAAMGKKDNRIFFMTEQMADGEMGSFTFANPVAAGLASDALVKMAKTCGEMGTGR